ncbi:hypothetical protein [Pedobacter alpinus]|uniref:Tissue inhibitor of metalloproteinase n=1 Tax=Pedobacter alpinus TaxID=1590643 RepID=A0ABW5TME4_9SPHI
MKSFKVLYIIIFSLTCYNECFGCDCKDISLEQDTKTSTHIFVGEILNVTEGYFEIKLIENFKGTPNKTYKASINSCTISPKKGEVWLLYGTENQDRSLDITYCGWSRNFNNPDESIHYMGRVSFTEQDFKKEIATLKKEKATLELKLDLIKLRESKHDIISKPISSIVNCGLIVLLLTFLILINIYLFLKNRQLVKKINVFR